MKKLISLISLTLLVGWAAQAQNHVFSVLANKGTNKIQQGTAWTNLNTGAKVYKGNAIKVSDGGYVGLMHKSGKTVEITASGEYQLSQLEAKLQTKSSSYAEKYAKFALNMEGSSHSKYEYNVTGSVERRIDGDFSLLASTENKVIKEIPLTITWMSTVEEKQTVELRLATLFGKSLFSVQTEENYATLNLAGVEIEDTENPQLIQLYDPESEEPILDKAKKVFVMSDEEAKPILEEYKTLSKELSDNSPMDQLVLAAFFEEKGLTGYAAASLHKAKTLAPEVEDFKGAYFKYLESKEIVVKEEEK